MFSLDPFTKPDYLAMVPIGFFFEDLDQLDFEHDNASKKLKDISYLKEEGLINYELLLVIESFTQSGRANEVALIRVQVDFERDQRED